MFGKLVPGKLKLNDMFWNLIVRFFSSICMYAFMLRFIANAFQSDLRSKGLNGLRRYMCGRHRGCGVVYIE